MVATAKLEHAAGVLGWVSSIIPVARPWLAAIWAATHHSGQSAPIRPGARERKHLVFGKQFRHTLRWLEALLKATVLESGGVVMLRKVYHFACHAPVFTIFCDACPWGMGGVLCRHDSPVAFWMDVLSKADLERFEATLGDPSFHIEWELLSLLSLKVLQVIVNSNSVQWFIRSDNQAALIAALELGTSSPLMTQLAVELAILIEAQGGRCVKGRHVAGVLNRWADSLSRVPIALQGCLRVDVPERCDSFYRVWKRDTA